MWQLAEHIRQSDRLFATFRAKQGAEFLAELETFEEGRTWLGEYRRFLDEYGHRGHSDRDIYFPRRCEDPMIDYNALRSMLSGDPVPDPSIREEQINERRDRKTAAVIANLRSKPLGALRVEVFKLVLNYCQKFIMARDNERHFIDISTFTMRRGFLELGRRLLERGLIDEERDVFFLAKYEVYDLFDGRANMTLTNAKIDARKRDFDRFDNKEIVPPAYIQHYQEIELEVVEHEGNVLKGTGTARGTITGTARLARKLSEIGRVKQGEILVVNSTDPGWTPVFNVIGGIVLETGGMTAHGSCLAREYGLPAVQLPNALNLIPDGATITVNGQSGQVVLHEPEPGADPPTEEQVHDGGSGREHLDENSPALNPVS
jgi:rifampicin phosphotransferase